MYKHTINFQIGDQFTLDDLKTIASRKYAEQIWWSIRLGENSYGEGSYLSSSPAEIIKILTTISDDDNIVCEVCGVEEDYDYLRIDLRCTNPDIEKEIYITSMRLSGLTRVDSEGREYVPRGQKGDDAIPEHSEAWYRDREHWSEFHGWNY